MDLIIVESPSKAKTISKYLKGKYKVDASAGHIRDLPVHTLGVDIKNNFEPKYVNSEGKEDIIKRLTDETKKADNVLLALRIDVFRLEIVFNIDAQRMDGQIADMPRRSVHFVLALQVFRDGLCLGRRLYDD